MAGRVYGRKYANKDEDFEEGEVWGVLEDLGNSPKKFGKPLKESCLFSSSSSARHFSTATTSRMIPRSSSSDVGVNGKQHQQQSSAPVDIPDWSKIYGNNCKNKKKNGSISSASSSSSSWANYGVNENNGCHNHVYYDHTNTSNGTSDQYYNGYGYDGHGNGDDDEDDDDEDGMVPPHEYLAKKLARSQISSFSVYEGIGRTLKGRDLSKVRNTILSKTGFLE